MNRLCSMPPISLAWTFSPSRVTADIYLLALAHHYRARLATFDRRIPAEAVRDGPAAIALIDA